MTTPELSFRKESGDVRVDLAMLLDTRMLVQGSSRSGKTHALFAMLEDTRGQVLQWIVDREADFTPLRAKFDYVVVGNEGDVPYDLKSKRGLETLVRKLLELKLNVIFDVSELPDTQRDEVVARLCNELGNLPRSSGLWTQMLLLIDELQHYAPQTGKEKAEVTRAIGLISSTGGKRGFCLIGATQAIAEVSKSAVRQLENKLILRTGSVDAERAARELRMKGDVVTELRSFDRGVGYAYGPAISLDPVLVRTRADLVIYPPKRGELRAPPPPPPNAIRKLISLLPAAQAAAEEEARSLETANAEIKRLRVDLKKLQRAPAPGAVGSAAPDAKAIERAVAAATRPLQQKIQEMEAGAARFVASAEKANRAVLAQLRQPVTKAEAAAARAAELIQAARAALDQAEDTAFGRAHADPAPTAAKAPSAAVRTAAPRPKLERRAAPSTTNSRTLPPGERAVLTAACQYPDGVTRQQLTILTGYKRSSRDAYIQRLRGAGLVDVQGDLIVAADGAEEHLGGFEPLPTGSALREYWLEKLPPGEQAVLKAAIEAWPDEISRDEISEVTGYKRSSRDAYIQRLKARQVIEVGAGVRAAPFLFD
jgi:hypothetical protein